MHKNDIYIIQGLNYEDMTRKLLHDSDLVGDIDHRCMEKNIDKNNIRISIKPNLVSPTEASYGATTHPEIVEGIILYLQENGFKNISMIEGSWVGAKTDDAFHVCGYHTLSKKYNVPFIDTQKDSFYTKDCKGMELKLSACTKSIDYLINVPVLKGHCQTKITCALKNLKGLIPNAEKRHFHSMGLHKPIGHLAAGIHQDFIVVDNICGDLDFEDGGNPVIMNRIWACKDPVLCDAYVCKMMDYNIEEVPYIGIAESLQVGSSDVKNAKIHMINENENFNPSYIKERKIVKLQDAVEEIDSCSACYGYLIPALDRLKQEGLLDGLNEKICIGQGFRDKEGILGIGQCTKKFDTHLSGCPPTESAIYDFLKKYIEKC